MRFFGWLQPKRPVPENRPRFWPRPLHCVEVDSVVHSFQKPVDALHFFESVGDGFVGDGPEHQHEVTLYVHNLERAKKWIVG